MWFQCQRLSFRIKKEYTVEGCKGGAGVGVVSVDSEEGVAG